ncbi:MAG: MBL fold metallo-hydrolase [endosymbiont of Galathealinum brachiosum]|uniref:MBL fold metallo-hydrolase n=1 Tax=endosymbiont of Galathealinum brachiosum TaxID=2200906 RepID=A0A370DAD8_9GAMM|nr:MAG: MBL fold metallo-hydrolase [endosymbiont of Galathealinum brachiosum]
MRSIMKKMFLLSVLLFTSPGLMADEFFDGFSADKINSTVYVIHGPRELPTAANRGFMNNPAFIIADKSVVVVDPGSSHHSGVMVLREIKKITDKPVSHIFNTHVHGDHWLANEIIKQRYPSVEIIADPRMIKKAKAGAAQTWLDNMLTMTEGATKGTKIAYPDTAVSDGKQLKVAGLNFNIHSVGIAHSDTDIMIEYVEGSTFFTGDNVGYLRILRMSDGSFRDVIKALDRAISLKKKHYIPGHGPSGDVKIVQSQREYFNILYTQVEKYYEEGLEDFEMKPMIEKALSEYKDWDGFDEELGKHISLAKLEVEKAEFE